MIGTVPDGWRVERLGDIVKIKKGKKVDIFEEYENGLFNYIDISVLRTKKYKYTDNNQIMATEKDILLVWDGANAGYSSFGLNGAVGSTLAKLSLKDENISFIYFGKLMLSKFEYLSDTSYGATIPHIQRQMLENIKVPLPPLPQQEKIVKVLDVSSQLIEKQKELIENYDLFLKSKFIEMFGDPIQNPMGWEVVKFSKLAKINTTSIKASEISNEIYIALDSIEKNTGKLVEAYNSEEVEIKSNKYIFTSNMLLYGKLRPYLNKVLLPEFNGICSTDILPIKPINTISTKQYIAYYLRNKKIVELLSNSVSGANLPRVSPKILKNLDIQKAPLELQNKFASIVEKINTIKAKETQKLEHLETLHSSLMDKAFKGEIQ